MQSRKEDPHYLSYKVRKEDQDREVLSVLRENFSLSTKKIRSVKYDPRGILVDGERVTVRYRLQEGEILEIMLNDSQEKEDRIVATPMKLEIIYEDEDLLFVNKPSGIVSHPSLGHSDDSLANGIKAYFLSKGERSGVHLIGRLDKDTSGILGVAKNGVTKDRMIAMRKEGKIEKEYMAYVEGILQEKSGVITYPMEEFRDESDGFKLKIRLPEKAEDGMEAITHYQVLEEREGYSVISLILETGRMHQIRFHMSAMGHPLLGDPIYGHGAQNLRKLDHSMLHAKRVRFPHPYRENMIDLEASLPEDFLI